jgi:polyphosphate kinase
MGRNLDRRVETVLPVLDPVLQQVICDDIIDVYVRDNVRSRTLQADGRYERRSPRPGEPRIDAQQTFLSRYRAV